MKKLLLSFSDIVKVWLDIRSGGEKLSALFKCKILIRHPNGNIEQIVVCVCLEFIELKKVIYKQ